MAPQTPHTGAQTRPRFPTSNLLTEHFLALQAPVPRSRRSAPLAFCRHQQAAGLDLCGLGIHRSDHPPVSPRNP